MNLILFPNQLFKKKYIPKNVKNIYLIEEPAFFGFREKFYNFNKLKLILHRASMKYYYDYLKSSYNIFYIDFNDVNYNIFNEKNLLAFHYYDYFLNDKLKNLNIKFLDTPNQVIKDIEFTEYYQSKKNTKKLKHTDFYNFVKQKLNILTNTKSQDKYNQNAPDKSHVEIKIPKLNNNDLKYINESKKYITKHFSSNYGNIDDFIYPISHKSSDLWLNSFIKNKFSCFGKYQDAIHNKDNFMYHSIISPMLNIGLLNPLEIIKKINDEYNKNKNIKLNDYEGFIRQIIGWRTYQILIYKFKYNEIIKSNIFNNTNRITKKFYNGNVGIPIIDFYIKNAFKYGYLHHIIRLMVISNFMNLCEIHPDDVYTWFMEFSVDSYDWVMVCNVYSMALWADGGIVMTKPYISSSNYLLKLSNFNKDEWTDIWNSLFYNFINKNKKILNHTIYKNSVNYWNKLDDNKKNEILIKSKNFIKTL